MTSVPREKGAAGKGLAEGQRHGTHVVSLAPTDHADGHGEPRQLEEQEFL